MLQSFTVRNFRYDVGQIGTTRARLHSKGGLTTLNVAPRAELAPPTPLRSLPHGYGPLVGLANYYTSAIQAGREGFLLTALQILEPRLTRLALLMMGQTPTVYGDVGIGAMLPISLMGGGTARLLYILLVIADSSGGIALIDEVESGFHYSVLTDVWRAIDRASLEANTQIFATTHSYENIRAALDAFEESGRADALRVFRLDRRNDDIRAVNYDAELLDAAIVTGLEVRRWVAMSGGKPGPRTYPEDEALGCRRQGRSLFLPGCTTASPDRRR